MQRGQKLTLQVTKYADGSSSYDVSVNGQSPSRAEFQQHAHPVELVAFKDNALTARVASKGILKWIPSAPSASSRSSAATTSTSTTATTANTANTFVTAPNVTTSATRSVVTIKKSRTTKTIATPYHASHRTADSFPSLCSPDLLVRCRSLHHLVTQVQLPVEGSKSSTIVARAAIQLGEEIRTVLSANAALFSSLWESRERTGEAVIRALHAKREKNVQVLLQTYNTLFQ